MSKRIVAAIALLAAGAASPSAGQEPAGAVPRTPWGHPDLQGRWTNATVTLLERPVELGSQEFFTDAEAAEYLKTGLDRFLGSIGLREEAALSGEFAPGIWVEERSLVATLRTSLIVGPTGRLPARVGGRAAVGGTLRTEAGTADPEQRTLPERCLWFAVGGPPMLPGAGYNSNYQIVQTPSHVTILAEMGSIVRIIPLDGRPHLPASIQRWHGDSRGRWDGDTLVVETRNFNDKTRFRGSTSRLRLVERFTRVNAGTIMYEFTASDPETWVEPWTAEIPMRSLDGELYEFACHEGNYGLANILTGARFEEQQARQP